MMFSQPKDHQRSLQFANIGSVHHGQDFFIFSSSRLRNKNDFSKVGILFSVRIFLVLSSTLCYYPMVLKWYLLCGWNRLDISSSIIWKGKFQMLSEKLHRGYIFAVVQSAKQNQHYPRKALPYWQSKKPTVLLPKNPSQFI